MVKALLAFATLVSTSVVLELHVVDFARSLKSDEESQRIFDRQRVAQGEESYDVLFFGDSTAGNSIVPHIFDEATGLQSYNLATSAATNSFSDLVLMETYLASHEPPKIFVLVRSPVKFAYPSAREMFFEEFPSVHIAWGMYLQGHFTKSEVVRSALASVFPSYRYSGFIRAQKGILTDPSQRPADSLPNEVFSDVQGYKFQDKQVTDKHLETWKNRMKDLGNEQDLQLNLAFLEEACSFASKRGIKFYIAFSPLLDVVESTIEIQNHIADSARRIDEIVAGHSHCMWLAREPLMYPREFMADSQHANFKGAKYFTEYLIRQLINQL